jgi:hypothetical protein
VNWSRVPAEWSEVVAPEADEEASPLERFLAEAALLSANDSISGQKEGITLMTLHTAKGLEWPVVVLAGMEDGLFPLARAESRKAASKKNVGSVTSGLPGPRTSCISPGPAPGGVAASLSREGARDSSRRCLPSSLKRSEPLLSGLQVGADRRQSRLGGSGRVSSSWLDQDFDPPSRRAAEPSRRTRTLRGTCAGNECATGGLEAERSRAW